MLGSFLWQGRVTSLFFLVFMGPPPEGRGFLLICIPRSSKDQDSSAFCLLRSKTMQTQTCT